MYTVLLLKKYLYQEDKIVAGFSDYLQNYINLKEITLKDLSEETDIDRTVLYRYVKGKRIPSDKDIVIRVADAAQMSVSEKRCLLAEYDKLVFGENVVYSYEYIKRLANRLGSLNKLAVRNSWRTVYEFKMEDMVTGLYSKEEIMTYILDLFRFIASQKSKTEKVLLVMQPVYDEIQDFMPDIFAGSHVEIEQIICIEQNIKQNHKNLELFEKILPLCFFLPKYNLYYYYDSLGSHINQMTVMPNIIIANDYVVQFDYNMKNGIVSHNKVYTDIVRQQYYTLKKETRRLFVNRKELFLSQPFMDIMDEPHGICLQKQFCMGNCLGKPVLEKHIYPFKGRDKLIERITGIYGEWNEEKYVNKDNGNVSLVSYGTAGGMEEFMRSGRIKEFPDRYYSPLSAEERMLVLDRMILLSGKGAMQYRLIADETSFSDGIIFYLAEGKKRFSLSKVTEKNIIQIIIDEQSIYRTFKMYLEYLEKKGMLYSGEETVQYLENLKKQPRVNSDFFVPI